MAKYVIVDGKRIDAPLNAEAYRSDQKPGFQWIMTPWRPAGCLPVIDDGKTDEPFIGHDDLFHGLGD